MSEGERTEGKRVTLLQRDDICAPPGFGHPILGNFIVWVLKDKLGRSDADAFGDALLNELEGKTHVLR